MLLFSCFGGWLGNGWRILRTDFSVSREGKKMGFELALLVVQICVAVSQLSVEGSPVKVPVPSNGTQASYPTKAAQPPQIFPDHDAQTPSSSGKATHQNPVATSPETKFNTSSTKHSSIPKAYHYHHALKPSSISLAPAASFPTTHKWSHGITTSPLVSFHKYHHSRKRFDHSSPGPSAPVHPHAYSIPEPSVSPSQSSIPSWAASAPSASIPLNVRPTVPPEISPLGPPLVDKRAPPPLFVMALPPPPPNENCLSVTCTDPLTYAPPGSPCGCVWPIQVKLHLGIPIYTFFTLVSELAGEIASSLVLSPTQVRVMGANAASQELDKCTVLIDLVPWEVKFDYATSISIYKKFWKRQVFIKASLFSPYNVVYVRYPGLPPSPPSASSEISAIDNEPYTRHPNDGQSLKPLGVDVPRKKKDGGLRRSIIAAIVVSSFTALLVFLGVIWLFLLKYGTTVKQPGQMQQNVTYSAMKPSVATKSSRGSISSSGSISNTYTISAKYFTFHEIQTATNGLHASRIIGEGGFGIVYRGTFDDGNEVAIKILKKDNQHGDREFMAEVEMLSRLHHRNLVKLIGICNNDEARCLVYELVPNQSLDSHLHGADKDVSPLDWGVRMKIALGAARGLAYLHEDSSPRVIHRDFKSSNILLENDFTPKVSDFGLARTALDEGNKFTSTRVMGTFGYLAPEYAMTGHLLVKSDVYSYGVVLLELLTGRKPVDLSQPPGQENLVSWARPLLTSKEGLELVIDPAIKTNTSLDSIAKVAAIASMCVQPEVSHRPFMGEVVQALKLVCNEFNETHPFGSRGSSAPGSYASVESKERVPSELLTVERSFDLLPESGIVLSASDYFVVPVGLQGQVYGCARRNSISGPLRTESRPFWERLTSSSRGSRSEHGSSTVKL